MNLINLFDLLYKNRVSERLVKVEGNLDTVKQAEDLKKLLKQLLIEKKRVRELQIKLEKPDQSSVHTLQEQLIKKETIISQLTEQLGKTKPALRQLFEQLNDAKVKLKNTPPPVDQSEIEERERMCQTALQEAEVVKVELEQAKATQKKEAGRFESERSRLVEKLAESLSQQQRQSETVKDLHEEINRLRQSNLELKQHLDKGQCDLQALMEQKQHDSEKLRHFKETNHTLEQREETLRSKLSFMEARLAESDIAAIHEDYTLKLQAQNEEISMLTHKLKEVNVACERLGIECQEKGGEIEKTHQQLEELKLSLVDFEQLKVQYSNEIRSMQYSYSEKEQEIAQAQHHLAKKVKEMTLLQDQSEEQKINIGQLEQQLAKRTAELDQSRHTLSLQKMHEEKLQQSLEEKAEKTNELSAELVQANVELENLQKIKRQHDDMATKLAELKTLLGRSFE